MRMSILLSLGCGFGEAVAGHAIGSARGVAKREELRLNAPGLRNFFARRSGRGGIGVRAVPERSADKMGLACPWPDVEQLGG